MASNNYSDLAWWNKPSRFWDEDTARRSGTVVRDWMKGLDPEQSYSYGDYESYVTDLVGQGLLTYNEKWRPIPTNAYWQQFHNTSFKPLANGKGAQRDYSYVPPPPEPKGESMAGAAYAEQHRQRQAAAEVPNRSGRPDDSHLQGLRQSQRQVPEQVAMPPRRTGPQTLGGY